MVTLTKTHPLRLEYIARTGGDTRYSVPLRSVRAYEARRATHGRRAGHAILAALILAKTGHRRDVDLMARIIRER